MSNVNAPGADNQGVTRSRYFRPILPAWALRPLAARRQAGGKCLGLLLCLALAPAVELRANEPQRRPALPGAPAQSPSDLDRLYQSIVRPAGGVSPDRYIRNLPQSDSESDLQRSVQGPLPVLSRESSSGEAPSQRPPAREMPRPVDSGTPQPEIPSPRAASLEAPTPQSELRRSRLLDEDPVLPAPRQPGSENAGQTAPPPRRIATPAPEPQVSRPRQGVERPEQTPVPRARSRPAAARSTAPLPRPAAGAPTRTAVEEAPAVSAAISIPGLPSSLAPTERVDFHTAAPRYYRGIYLTAGTAGLRRRYTVLLEKAAHAGINTLVVDVQPRPPSPDFLQLARSHGLYLVARVVVFDGGLREYPPPQSHLQRVLQSAESAARLGFSEVQLDYIRFADRLPMRLSQRERYNTIAGILKLATERLRPYHVRVGADTFGRISFNRNDMIGQKIEVFSPHLDTLYPMLYPSHFYGDPDRRRNPYKTILDGVVNTMRRASEQTRVVAYIQSFMMRHQESGLSYEAYIRKQLDAARTAGGGGFVAWNPRNDYTVFFRALEQHDRTAAQ
ncbi:MAG: hypothetical protein K1X75_13630 [Leptospirales bacterium]|nr:hypothetical protein [Leptospirales bacterium]